MGERAGGSKYDKNLSIKEIAVRVRKDIAAAIEAGNLPEMKVSVRVQHYSGGRALHVKVTKLQEGFRLFNRKRLVLDLANPHAFTREPIYTPAGEGLLTALKRLVNAYNYDRSDSQSDHFDVNFYEHVDLWWEYERDLKAAAIAAVQNPRFGHAVLDRSEPPLVFCDCCVPSHLDLAMELRDPALGGTCAACGAHREAFQAPQVPLDFPTSSP
jgi:hypothetical protein